MKGWEISLMTDDRGTRLGFSRQGQSRWHRSGIWPVILQHVQDSRLTRSAGFEAWLGGYSRSRMGLLCFSAVAWGEA